MVSLDIYNSSTSAWEDLTKYIDHTTFKGSEKGIEGLAKGNAIIGTKIRDLLRYEKQIPVVTIAIPLATAQAIRRMILAESFEVRTDYFTGQNEIYQMFADGLVMAHVIDKSDQTTMVKLSFNLIEM